MEEIQEIQENITQHLVYWEEKKQEISLTENDIEILWSQVSAKKTEEQENCPLLTDVIEELSDNRLTSLSVSKVRVLSTVKNPMIDLIGFRGHTHIVLCVTTLLNGKTVISGSADKTLRVWDVNQEKDVCLKVLLGHTSMVLSVVALPDGKTVISGSFDNTLKIWDIETGVCVNTLLGHEGAVSSLVVLPDGKTVMSGSHDGTLKVWNINTGLCLKTLSGHTEFDFTNFIYSLAVLPGGKAVVSGSSDGVLKVWDLDTGKCLRIFQAHTNPVKSLAVLPDGKIISGSGDKTIKVWDLNKNQCSMTLSGHTGIVTGLVVLSDKTFVSSSSDCTMKWWNPRSGLCLQTFIGHKSSISGLAVLSDSYHAGADRIVSVAEDGLVMVRPLIKFYQKLSLQETNRLFDCIVKNRSLTVLDLSHLNLSSLSIDVGDLLWVLCRNKTLKILDISYAVLQNNNIYYSDNKFIKILQNISVKTLNLSGNRLTFSGIKSLFLTMLQKTDSISIQEILLKDNLIDVRTLKKWQIFSDYFKYKQSLRNLQTIDFTGNFIASDKRNEALKALVKLLLEKTHLTVGECIALAFHKIKKTNEDKYELELIKDNQEHITIMLDNKDLQNFQKLGELVEETTYEAIFNHITVNGINIKNAEMDEDLKAVKYNNLSGPKQEAVIKDLVDYHPKGPVKSCLNTNPLFYHSVFYQASSVLCPTKIITHKIGMVFLLAIRNPASESDKPVAIAYEWINNQQQRCFKVAYLSIEEKICFFVEKVGHLLELLKKEYLMTAFVVTREQIKQLHSSITEDAKELSNAQYKFKLPISEENTVPLEITKKSWISCALLWAYDKIQTCTDHSIREFIANDPQGTVQRLIDSPDQRHSTPQGATQVHKDPEDSQSPRHSKERAFYFENFPKNARRIPDNIRNDSSDSSDKCIIA